MKTETYYKITNGEIVCVTRSEQRCSPSVDILSKYANASAIRHRNIMGAVFLGDDALGNIGVSLTQKVATYTIQCRTIPLRTRFKLDGKVMVPLFGTHNNEPILQLKWTAPDSMRIYLIVEVTQQPTGRSPSTFQCSNQWLVAVDSSQRYWRLPTSNVYEDCRLCIGTFDSVGTSHVDVLSLAWKQFHLSEWNTDLSDRAGSGGAQNAAALFRFTPNEKEGFTQLPCPASWMSYCTKISNEHINQNIAI